MWAVVDIASGESETLLQQLLGFWDGQSGNNLKKCLLQLLAV
jgi:hypothetical protein